MCKVDRAAKAPQSDQVQKYLFRGIIFFPFCSIFTVHAQDQQTKKTLKTKLTKNRETTPELDNLL